ncbi:hypothetical protein D3C72_2583310 [compost metagenome]
MVFHGFPIHDQRIALRLFDAAIQLHGMASAGAQEKRLRLGNACFEQRFLSFADQNAGNLLNHG